MELLAATGDGTLKTPRLVSPPLCQVRTAVLRVPDRTRHVALIPVFWDPRESHSPLLGTLDYLFRFYGLEGVAQEPKVRQRC